MDRSLGVLQREQKQGPGNQGLIEVEEIENEMPICVDNGSLARKFYRRTSGITSGWNDTDLFYADGTGPLVQITTATVNDYWDPRYDGFDKLSGPDWTKNCEAYAKAGGFGDKLGDYDSKESLATLIEATRGYVLSMGYHWMRVAKTGANAVTLQQKDQESAVYKKDFTLQDALTYILNKYSSGGSVYKNS